MQRVVDAALWQCDAFDTFTANLETCKKTIEWKGTYPDWGHWFAGKSAAKGYAGKGKGQADAGKGEADVGTGQPALGKGLPLGPPPAASGAPLASGGASSSAAGGASSSASGAPLASGGASSSASGAPASHPAWKDWAPLDPNERQRWADDMGGA